MSQVSSLAFVIGFGQLAAAIALLNGILTTLGQGNVVARAIESIARQPEARGSIMPTMFIGLAFAETSGVYGLLIAIILLFANPMVSLFIANM
jgi:F-type H+-transporting ATPase subunit c